MKQKFLDRLAQKLKEPIEMEIIDTITIPKSNKPVNPTPSKSEGTPLQLPATIDASENENRTAQVSLTEQIEALQTQNEYLTSEMSKASERENNFYKCCGQHNIT